MGVEITLPGTWLGVDWTAVSAIAAIIAGCLAAWAVRATYKEMGRAESRHVQQLSAQVRPLVQGRRVMLNRTNPAAIPQVTTENIGVGPARAVMVRVWFVPLPAPITPDALSSLSASIDDSPGQYASRNALIGGLRAENGARQSDLAGDALRVTTPAGYQLVAHWKGTCRDTFLVEHQFSGSVNVVDELDRLITGDAPVAGA